MKKIFKIGGYVDELRVLSYENWHGCNLTHSMIKTGFLRLMRMSSSKQNNAKINRLITQTVQYIERKFIQYMGILQRIDMGGGGRRLLDLKYYFYPGWTTRYWSLAKQKGQTRIWILYMKQGNEKGLAFSLKYLKFLRKPKYNNVCCCREWMRCSREWMRCSRVVKEM